MRLPFALIATCLILSGCAGSLGPQGDPWIRGQLGDAISCDACTVTLEGDVWTVTVGESGSLVWTGP